MTENVESKTLETGVPHVETGSAQEKLLPQSEVNKLVGAEKNRSYDKGYQAALAQVNAQPQQSATFSQPTTPGVDHQQLVAQEVNRQMEAIRQQHQKELWEQERNKTIREMEAKMNAAHTDYPDYDNVVKSVKWENYPDVIHMANLADNAGHIMYDLAQNPHKIASLRVLSQDPHLAALEIKKLSDSIKVNQNAKNLAAAPQPLGQVKPSTATADSGAKTVQDFKRMFK